VRDPPERESVTNLLTLEHDPEKWVPVFRKRSCSNKKIERDNDSKKSHPALKRSKKINNELLVSDHPSTQNHNSQRGAPLNEINMPPKPFC
jgi:hypothetical protein